MTKKIGKNGQKPHFWPYPSPLPRALEGTFFSNFFLKFLPFVVHCVGNRDRKLFFRFLHFGPHFWPFSAFKLNFGPKFGPVPSGTKFFLASLQSLKRSVKKNRKKNAKIIPPPTYDTVQADCLCKSPRQATNPADCLYNARAEAAQYGPSPERHRSVLKKSGQWSKDSLTSKNFRLYVEISQ